MRKFTPRRGIMIAVAAIAALVGSMALSTAPASAEDEIQPAYVLPLPQDAADRAEWGSTHHTYPAVDIPVPTGTESYASVAGDAVVFSDDGCGNGVQIEGVDGATYVYCHFDSHSISSGPVDAGDLIGLTGNTGNSTGPHLHYQIRYADELRCPQEQVLAIFDGDQPPPPGDLATSGCTH